MSLHPHVTSSSGSQIFSTDPCASKIMYLKSSNWLHPVNCYPKKRSQSDNKSATVTLVCLTLAASLVVSVWCLLIPCTGGHTQQPFLSQLEPPCFCLLFLLEQNLVGLTLFFHAGFMLLILLTAKATQFSILIQKRVFSICQTLNMLVTPPDS